MFQVFHNFVNITIASVFEAIIYISLGFVLYMEFDFVNEPRKSPYLKVIRFCFIFLTFSWASHKFFKIFLFRQT